MPMSRFTQIYVGVVCTAALIAAALLRLSDSAASSREVTAVAVLAGLAIVAELLSFLLPSGGRGTVAHIPYLAAVLVAPSWVTVAAACGVKMVS